MIEELASVVLTADLPKHGLMTGDIGTVVMVHEHSKGYTVEFVTLHGETIALVTLPAAQVRAIRTSEIARARDLTA